mmetsp:Transcript_29015/g.89813  ORF Transcript_29015/g.89813 Transcript_29015/m.89813 type:complete len:234 (-) Transcript_29015:753-1454(-)
MPMSISSNRSSWTLPRHVVRVSRETPAVARRSSEIGPATDVASSTTNLSAGASARCLTYAPRSAAICGSTVTRALPPKPAAAGSATPRSMSAPPGSSADAVNSSSAAPTRSASAPPVETTDASSIDSATPSMGILLPASPFQSKSKSSSDRASSPASGRPLSLSSWSPPAMSVFSSDSRFSRSAASSVSDSTAKNSAQSIQCASSAGRAAPCLRSDGSRHCENDSASHDASMS